MRRLVFHIQATLDLRISTTTGDLWEPFPWGEVETAYLSEIFRGADTWVLSRKLYEVIVPYWDQVAHGTQPAETGADREFAAVLHSLGKVAISRTLEPTPERSVIADDVPAALEALKRQNGKDILLSCGPATLAPLAATPGLIDEFLLSLSPIVLSDGPRIFDRLANDLALELVDSKVFDAGVVLLRYRSS
ncbi:dihydrofolate reductase family protein [Tenggerimyces flavus]|uniref:Dihydrofolate reductase family protein n=1 Tax=Tenggerimyces flavus TaxID=1708749 RepID=A0ABV7Y7R5_9ACTN|nr:dihydrofolate reductase family protein [Tenggerimyces flavus]MBM7785607.1 dihydrofolate reductase [Tenggerimyces flavus]